MARIDTDFVAILNAVVARLKSQVTLPDGVTPLTDSTCFIWLEDDDRPPPTASNVFLTVDMDGGDFDEAMFVGGGVHQLVERTNVLVTIHSSSRADAGGRDERFVLDPYGLFPMAKKVLLALAGWDLVVDDDGNTCLREFLRPSGRGKPRRRTNDKYGSLTLQFAVMYDWDLS